MRTTFRFPLCMLLSTGLTAFAAVPDKSMKLDKTTLSPKKDIKVQEYSNTDGEHQVWLAPARKGEAPVLLFTHHRDASVVMSPDEQLVVINNFATSSGGGPLLYRRSSGLTFAEDTNAKMEDKANDYMLKQNPATKKFPEQAYDHFTAKATTWSKDSKKITVVINANGGQKSRPIQNFVCTYSVVTGAYIPGARK